MLEYFTRLISKVCTKVQDMVVLDVEIHTRREHKGDGGDASPPPDHQRGVDMTIDFIENRRQKYFFCPESTIVNFMVCQDRLQTIFLPLFRHQENSE